MKAKRTERRANGRKRRRLGLVLLLAVILTVPSLQTWAQGYVDTQRSCSMQISISNEEDYTELKKLDVTARLYRIADISRSGAYTAVNGYTDIQSSLDAITADSKASDWEAIAALAQKDAAAGKADAAIVLKNGVGSVSDLPTGLYLVLADSVQTDAYAYDFTCGLISAPENAWLSMGQLPDEWVYDQIAVTLKPTRNPLAGEVLITKTLKGYNPSLGNPLFAFDVEVYNGNTVVYSNVVSLSFTQEGSKSVTVSGLPVGSRVVVTEVYSGASYTAVSPTKVTIEKLEAGEPAKADFTNAYADKLVYGNGVVNHFSYDGSGYSWTQQTDNSSTVNGIRQ
ncbi:MAG: DUF5979 domain-containing protein [Muribaculaceae bacterium]|nr:DUF5979 domain-containing protein [Roseburia sp.]MCM1431671.1 DUF5979 domain-containing protein [Muribaculaceae bacterium]MCM1491657.1 DUF5979 domain-containing protein [Muribaculaceae bacterium]